MGLPYDSRKRGLDRIQKVIESLLDAAGLARALKALVDCLTCWRKLWLLVFQ